MLNRSRYLILKQITYSESVKGSLSSSLKKYKKNQKVENFHFLNFLAMTTGRDDGHSLDRGTLAKR